MSHSTENDRFDVVSLEYFTTYPTLSLVFNDLISAFETRVTLIIHGKSLDKANLAEILHLIRLLYESVVTEQNNPGLISGVFFCTRLLPEDLPLLFEDAVSIWERWLKVASEEILNQISHGIKKSLQDFVVSIDVDLA